MKSKNIEVEGNEFLLESNEGHYAVIPAKDRNAVMAMIGCDDCINSYIKNLPKESDYAEDGTLVLNDNVVVNPNKDILLDSVTVQAKAPRWLRDKRKLEEAFEKKNPQTENEFIKKYKPDIFQELEKNRIDRKIEFVNTELEKLKQLPDYNEEDEAYDKEVLKKDKPKKEFNINNIENLESLSKDEIGNVQKFLVENEYIKSKPDDISLYDNKEKIIKLQTKLKNKGYDLGKFGANKDGVDGVIGLKTKIAFEDYNKNKEVDKLLGPKTRSAFEKYKEEQFKESLKEIKKVNIPDIKSDEDIPKIQTSLLDKGYLRNTKESFNFNVEDNITSIKTDPFFRISNEKKCSSKECTYFVNQEIEKKVGTTGREEIGAYGDAWTIIDRMKNSGNTEIFNAFPSKKAQVNDPNKFMDKITKDKLSQLNEDSFKDGDVIGLYYGGSPSTSKAYSESNRTFSTHTGIVKVDGEGNKFIEHNVSGTIYKEPIQDYLKDNVKNKNGLPIRVTAIIRPNYKRETEANIYDSTEYSTDLSNVTNPNTAFGKKQAAVFGQFLIENKDKIVSDFPINNVEYDKLAKAAKAIAWKESYYEAQPKALKKHYGSEIREAILGTEASKGYTQLKDESNFDPIVRTKLGITNETLETPQGSALATMYALTPRYVAIKNEIAKIDNAKFTTDQIAQLALLAWNEPLHKVIETVKKRKSFSEVIKAYETAYGKNEKGESKLPYAKALIAYNKFIKE
jgi:hypothetical protein